VRHLAFQSPEPRDGGIRILVAQRHDDRHPRRDRLVAADAVERRRHLRRGPCPVASIQHEAEDTVPDPDRQPWQRQDEGPEHDRFGPCYAHRREQAQHRGKERANGDEVERKDQRPTRTDRHVGPTAQRLLIVGVVSKVARCLKWCQDFSFRRTVRILRECLY